jgi:hypothetical protein
LRIAARLTVSDNGHFSENDEQRVAYLWGVAGIRPIGMHPKRAEEITARVEAAECPMLEEFMGANASHIRAVNAYLRDKKQS